MSPSEIELLVWMRDASQTGELRRIRVESQLSLDDVASVGPVHPTTVWKWEKGERRVTSTKPALRVAQLLRKLQRQLESA